jgi:tRNA threonylcarbamoyladenosine biosynthesis protein TsaB
MAIILNIDTAVDTASVCLARDSRSLQFSLNDVQRDHAAWLHPAILRVTRDAGLNISDLDAVAVTIGPGSYTGLRVGLSTAKGLCFSLGIPLIAINTLKMMAYAAKEYDTDLLCPMIDARRMEVFTAVYDKNLTEIIEPAAMILNPASFESLLDSKRIVFSGNGAEKLKSVIDHRNAFFSSTVASAADMAYLSEQQFLGKEFADLAYTEPLYLKEFHTVTR